MTTGEGSILWNNDEFFPLDGHAWADTLEFTALWRDESSAALLNSDGLRVAVEKQNGCFLASGVERRCIKSLAAIIIWQEVQNGIIVSFPRGGQHLYKSIVLTG